VRHSNGEEFPLQVATSCCGGGFGWPLADEAWLGRVSEAGFTGVHVRPGPFLIRNEAEWDIGPYQEVGGVAVLTRWNDEFWAQQVAMMKKAHELGIIVEVDIIDGWRCKRRDVPSPWDPENNVDRVDGRSTCGRELQPIHKLWIRQVVWTYGQFTNVIWQDGNEIGLTRNTLGVLVADPQYEVGWTEEMRSLVRETEKEFGFPEHLFGTNAPEAYGGSADYVTVHNRGHAVRPIAGKPTRVNEYNPAPPPVDVAYAVCEAKAFGSYFDYWRSGHSEVDMARTWQLIAGGCEGPQPGDCPWGTPTARTLEGQGVRVEIRPKQEGKRGFGATPLASFGKEYYCQPGLWPEACADGRTFGPVAPDGHPDRVACEKQFLELPCANFTNESRGHMSFDPFIVINGVNQNHPRNVDVCGQARLQDDPSWRKEPYQGQMYIVEGQWSWATAHGNGRVCAEAKDGAGRHCVSFTEP
jgi:hypothetical protein